MTDTETDPGKGRPTPTRKEREAANKKPIVVADRKLARQQSREKDKQDRAAINAGYAAGEEKYLPARDKGQVKRYARDYIDARFGFGEWVIPVLFVVILGMYVLPTEIQGYVTYALIAFFAIVLLDAWLAARQCQKKVDAKFGTRTERVRWYAGMRSLQMRMMRMPKPQVKRFQFPE